MPCLCAELQPNPLKSLSLRLVGYSITFRVTLELSLHLAGEEAIHSESPLGRK